MSGDRRNGRVRVDLIESRARFEGDLARFRQAIARESGRRPKRTGWILPAVAAAAGLALAWGLKVRLKRRSGER